MNTPPQSPSAPLPLAVSTVVEQAFAAASKPPQVERRTSARTAYNQPVYITPVGAAGELMVEETFVALGKNISPTGIDFFSFEALPFRRAVISLKSGVDVWSGVTTLLRWCRFTEFRCYENGGMFLSAAPSPMLELADSFAADESPAVMLRQKLREPSPNSEFFPTSLRT